MKLSAVVACRLINTIKFVSAVRERGVRQRKDEGVIVMARNVVLKNMGSHTAFREIS